MNPIERSQNRERKRRLKKQQKRYIAEERKSLKRERLEIRIKTASMRKRMRRARIEAFIKAVKDFFGKPIAKGKYQIQKNSLGEKLKRTSGKETESVSMNYLQNFPIAFQGSGNTGLTM